MSIFRTDVTSAGARNRNSCQMTSEMCEQVRLTTVFNCGPYYHAAAHYFVRCYLFRRNLLASGRARTVSRQPQPLVLQQKHAKVCPVPVRRLSWRRKQLPHADVMHVLLQPATVFPGWPSSTLVHESAWNQVVMSGLRNCVFLMTFHMYMYITWCLTF